MTSIRSRLDALVDELLDGHILLEEAASEFEKLYIQKALLRNANHISETAAAIGVHRNTLSKKIAIYERNKTLPASRRRRNRR
jgi:DNA-binding NtrC family response regulator